MNKAFEPKKGSFEPTKYVTIKPEKNEIVLLGPFCIDGEIIGENAEIGLFIKPDGIEDPQELFDHYLSTL